MIYLYNDTFYELNLVGIWIIEVQALCIALVIPTVKYLHPTYITKSYWHLIEIAWYCVL